MLLKSDDFLSKNDDFLLNNVDFHNINRSSASCPISTLLVSDFALYFTPLLLSYFNDSPPFSLYVSPLRLSTFCIFTLFAPILLQFCSNFAPILLQFCSNFAPILLQFCSTFTQLFIQLSGGRSLLPTPTDWPQNGAFYINK